MYNSSMRRTFGVCLVESDEVTRVIGRLQHAQSFASNPLLLPIILLSMNVNVIWKMQSEAVRDYLGLEVKMGYIDEDYKTSFDQEKEFKEIPQRLNVLSSQLANMQYFCSCFLQALDCLDEQLQTLPDGHCTGIAKELQEQMVYFRVCSETIGRTSQRGNATVQSMTQTVRIPLTISVKDQCL